MLFFITGASGSGKSACLPALQAAVRDVIWRDFDEVGVPNPCPADWRPKTTEHWLWVAIENQKLHKDTGITGSAVPGEILACPSALQINGIHIVLLDCRDVERIERLRKRGSHGATQEMLNWAAWQRMHAVDPEWRPDVIRKQDSWPKMCWERWADWKRGDVRWKVDVLDTTHLTVPEVVSRLATWVCESRMTSRSPRHR